MTVTKFEYDDRFGNTQTVNFPATMDSDNHNFYDVLQRNVRLPGVSGGFDARGAGPNEKAVGNIGVSFRLRYDWAMDEYSESDAQVAMRTALDALRRLGYVGLGKLYKTFQGAERWAWCKISNLSIPNNQSQPVHLWQPVRLNFQTAKPFWYGSAVNIAAQAFSGGNTNLPLISYGGIAPATVRVRIVAGTNGVDDPEVLRIVSAAVVEQVSLAETIANTGTWVFDAGTREVLRNGTLDYVNFDYETASWLTLHPGNNLIRVKCSTGSSEGTIEIDYTDTY